VGNSARNHIRERINEKKVLVDRENVEMLSIVPQSSQNFVREIFEPEIRELINLGFSREGLEWVFYKTPVDYKCSGSSMRVVLTTVKSG